MVQRILTMAVLAGLFWTVPLLAQAPAGTKTYRVTIVLYPGDDVAAVARRLAAMYRGTLETPVDGDGSFTISLSEAGAGLMRRDPMVAEMEAPSLAPFPSGAASGNAAVPAAPGTVQANATTNWSIGPYRYDGSGNIRAIGSDFYVYDKLGRVIVSADAPPSMPVIHKQTYTYDPYGNLSSMNTAGRGLTTFTMTGVSNRLFTVSNGAVSAPVGYDAAGNFVSYQGATYEYDALNAMRKSVAGGVTRSYVYTANDERIGTVEETGSGVRSEWTIRDSAGRVLRRFSKESNGEWKWQEDYIYRGSQMLAAEVPDSAKTRHFHLDHLGTPRLITGNGGAEISRHTYHPFGEEIAPSAGTREKQQFTGHERDSESLDYMHARFYAPFMGRFLSVDPGRADLNKPQSWNRYSYTMNDPLNNNDPDGRETNPVTGQSYILDSQILNSRNNPRKGFFGMVRRNADGSSKKHGGNDIAAPRGTPVFAPISGTVVQSGDGGKDGGFVLRIRRSTDENGQPVFVHISHLDKPPNVKVGDTVVEGQPNVAEVGNTGNAKNEPPHAHTAVMVGGDTKDHQVDPQQWFRDHPSTAQPQPQKQKDPCEPNKQC